MRRTPATVAVTVIGLLLLSGCFKVDADLTVHSDETVDGTMIVAVEQEFVDAMGAMGGEDADVEDMLGDPEDLPEGAEVDKYEQGGYVGQLVTFEGVTLDELTSTVGEGDAAGEEWSLTHEGDEFVFDATMDLTSGEDEMDMSGMMEGAEMSISLTFPGEVTESNGEVDGNTVTWEPEFGELNEMHAVAADDAGFPVALVVGIVVGLAMLGGIAVFLLRGRRTGQPGTADLDPRT